MSAGLLSWGAQVAGHAAYIEAHQVEVAPAPSPRSANGKRRSTANAERNRSHLLHALADGKPRRYVDLRAALPNLTRNGIYYLIAALEAEGLIVKTGHERGNRRYQLTPQGARHEH
jgi:hypothetical protein